MQLIHNGLPDWVFYGEDALCGLSRRMPEGPALLISDENLAHTASFAMARDRFPQAEVYLLPAGEPRVSDGQRALDAARELNAASIIGVGGGSVLDVAKATAALCRDGHELRERIGAQELCREVWLALIPTTAGTGSEATRNCLFIDDDTGIKVALIADACLPDAVALDAALTRSLPASVAAFTGVDALCHCAESYLSVKATDWSRVWSSAGMELVRVWLPRAVCEPDNAEARQKMLLASFLGGAALALAGTTAVHALAYSLGKRGVPHGVANSLLFEQVMNRTLEAPEAALPRYNELCAMIRGLPIPALTRYAVRPEDCASMAREAMGQTRLLGNHPTAVSEEKAYEIFEALFEGGKVRA